MEDRSLTISFAPSSDHSSDWEVPRITVEGSISFGSRAWDFENFFEVEESIILSSDMIEAFVEARALPVGQSSCFERLEKLDLGPRSCSYRELLTILNVAKNLRSIGIVMRGSSDTSKNSHLQRLERFLSEGKMKLDNVLIGGAKLRWIPYFHNCVHQRLYDISDFATHGERRRCRLAASDTANAKTIRTQCLAIGLNQNVMSEEMKKIAQFIVENTARWTRVEITPYDHEYKLSRHTIWLDELRSEVAATRSVVPSRSVLLKPDSISCDHDVSPQE